MRTVPLADPCWAWRPSSCRCHPAQRTAGRTPLPLLRNVCMGRWEAGSGSSLRKKARESQLFGPWFWGAGGLLWAESGKGP